MSRMHYPPPPVKNFAAIQADQQLTRFRCRSCLEWLPGAERAKGQRAVVCRKCHVAITATHKAAKRRRLGLEP